MTQPKKTTEIPSIEEVAEVRQTLKNRNMRRKALRSTVSVLVVVIAITFLLVSFVFPIAKVSGKSMEPNLKEGEILIMFKTTKFTRGDLCCFSYQNQRLIKRVIGCPGDIVEINEEGTVKVNDQEIDEPYIKEKGLGECNMKFPYQVPDNSFFLLGDNRGVSIDSRSTEIGCVPKEQIVGKVILRIWPSSEFSLMK